MTCHESDMEKLFFWFFLKSLDKLYTCFHGIHELDILGLEVFVQLKTIIRSMFKTTNESFCSFDFFLILLHMRNVRVGLNKSAIAKALVYVAIPLLKDMG